MKRFTHCYINQITGAFVLLALLVLVAVVYIKGQGDHWFEGTLSFGLLLPEEGSYGLKPGAAVMVLGAEAGKVTHIEITPGNRMMARMSIRQDFARFVGTDSRATIKKVLGVAGDAFVHISGRPGQPLHGDAMIEATVDRAIIETVQETLEQIRTELLPAIQSIRLAAESHVQLTTSLEKPALETLETIHSIAVKIDKGKGIANRVLTDKQLADDASAAVDRANLMIDGTTAAARAVKTGASKIGNAARKLNNSMEELPKTVHRANITLEEIHKLSQNLNSQVMSLSGVIIQTQATLREIQRFVEAAQRHWLLRGYVEDDLPPARISPREVIPTP